MNLEEEIIKHIAPELYRKISNLEQAIDFIKEDISKIRNDVSSLQDLLIELSKLVSELKGRYENIEDSVITKLKNDLLVAKIKGLLEKK